MSVSRFSAQRLGEFSALASIVLWALFPFLVHPSLNPLPPLLTAALSTLFAVIPMLVAVYLKQSWSALAIRSAWPAIFYATLLVGVIFYALFFWAAKLTSPVNLALLGLMEVPFSFLFLRRYHSERVSSVQAVGSVLMVCGAAVIIFRPEMQINAGDLLVVAACTLPPFGNYYAKQARQLVGSEIILFLRSAIGGLILLAAALLYEGLPSKADLVTGLPFVALAGFLPMGISKLLWTEAVHRLPIPKAVSSAALVPALTVVLSFLILGTYPTKVQLVALLPVCVGVILTVHKEATASAEELAFEP